MPTISTPTKVQNQTTLYDTILSLCFTGNTAIWDRKSSIRATLEKIKRGDISLTDTNSVSQELLTFFTGALLAAFAVFPSLANVLLRCESMTSEQLLLVLEGGKRLAVPQRIWSNELEEFIGYYKYKILGWEKAPRTFNRNDWQSLRDAFKYSQERLAGEQSFLKSLIGSSKKILSFLKEPRIRMDSLFIILSVLPSDQLNMFFLEIAQDIPEYLTEMTQDGLYIDIRHYFSQSSVDTGNLFGKIKMLLMLYSRHEIVIDYVVEARTKELLLKYLQNDVVRDKALEQIEKTIYGQYQPRLDFAKAFAKILS